MKTGLAPALFAFCFSTAAFGQEDCKDEYWTLKGNIKKEITRFDTFMKTLGASKNPIAEINNFIAQHGLPQRLGMSSEEAVAYPHRVEGEEDAPGGPVALIFLKSMKVRSGSGLVFDQVHEVDSVTALKPKKTWEIPKDSLPDAIEGDELILTESLSAICGTESKTIAIAIKSNGEYRAVDHESKNDRKRIPAEKCKAAKNIFESAENAYCAEVTDLKSKKKRILIWELPEA